MVFDDMIADMIGSKNLIQWLLNCLLETEI